MRTEIHSSEVSTIFARSSLETERVGTADPQLTNLQPLLTSLYFFRSIIKKVIISQENHYPFDMKVVNKQIKMRPHLNSEGQTEFEVHSKRHWQTQLFGMCTLKMSLPKRVT